MSNQAYRQWLSSERNDAKRKLNAIESYLGLLKCHDQDSKVVVGYRAALALQKQVVELWDSFPDDVDGDLRDAVRREVEMFKGAWLAAPINSTAESTALENSVDNICRLFAEAIQPTLADRLDARQDSIHSTDSEKVLRAKVVKREGEAGR